MHEAAVTACFSTTLVSRAQTCAMRQVADIGKAVNRFGKGALESTAGGARRGGAFK